MSSSSAYLETPAATMRLAFPKPPDPSLGTPTLFVLNDLLQYMCKCAQTHKSPISKKMNLLYVAIDPTLYAHYAGGEAYPIADYPFPPEPTDVPDYTGATDANTRLNIKTTHAMAVKRRNDVINMNTALIDAFLDLIPVAFKQSYEQIRMENPNSVFREMFTWFVTKYGRTSAEDRASNRNAMALEWHPSQGFELLIARLFRGATFAALAKYPIPDDDIVDIGIRVLHRTGLFAEEYKTWITRGDDPANDMSFAAFRIFWETAVNIAAFTATPASQHGYGMAAAEDDASTASLTDAVSNFGVAYAATQESLRSTNATISAMQGQLQMLCNVIGNQPPPGMLQFHQPPGQSRRSRGRRGGGRGGGTPQGYGGGGYNGGNPPPHGGGATFPTGAYNNNGNTGGGGGGYSATPPSPVKRFENWNYCHTHGGDIDDNHTSATCARPGEQHQRAATRTNTMNGNMRGMHKSVLPSTVGRRPPVARPPPAPVNYTPTFTMPFGDGGPRFPSAPGSWGFGPHAAAYQRANNIPPPQPGTAMMANTMAFNNSYPFPTATPTVTPPPSYGSAPPPGNPVWFQNHF